jgi:putative ABC transport system permease protein
MKPSIKKVIRDLLNNRSRTLIVLLAIILGAFGVSMMTTAYNLLGKNLNDNYLRTNPASFTVVVDSISNNILQEARLLPGIEYAETRSKIIGRIEVNKNEFIPLWLYVVDNFEKTEINKFRLQSGNVPVSSDDILVERTGDRLTDISIGRSYNLTIPGIGVAALRISGIVHDPAQAPSWMEGLLYGYVRHDFINKMQIRDLQPEIKFTISSNKFDLHSIEDQLSKTIAFLEKNNIKVIRTEILTPGRHVHQSQMDSLMFLLQMFGVLALILSCFLIINMIMAIMAKETRQIGVMKAIGAGTMKITSIYLIIVLVFGFVATLIALPLGFLAGKAYAGFVASMLNFELFNQQISHSTLLFQIAIGTLLPALVSLYPVYRASRISVHKALNDYGVDDNLSLSSGHSNRLTGHLKISNTTLFAIRNTFRRKGRLILTLITLVMGGAVFMSAFNIRTSLKNTVKNRFTNQRYDIQAIFSKGINEANFRSSIDSLSFISDYEFWGYGRATRIFNDHPESEVMDLKLVPLKTYLFVPEIINGRWLSGDPGEAVVNHMFLTKYPDASVGNEITLKMKGKTKTFKIIGTTRELFSSPAVYVSKSNLSEWPMMAGKTNSLLLAFNNNDGKGISSLSTRLEQWFQTKKYPVSLVFRKDQYKERVIDHLVVITSMLIMVTVLLIIVGGLGLITTMGINIVERIREMAILKAIGVTDKKLYGVTITEGFMIGFLSWAIAIIVSVPVSYYLGNKFFNIFFETSLNFNISLTGIVVWLGIIVLFSAVAVLVPALNANEQSISTGLSYE